MEELHDALVRKQRLQHAQVVHLERVHDDRLVVGGKLQQAQLRVVGLLAQEFGVDGKHRRRPGTLHERFEALLVCYVHWVVLQFRTRIVVPVSYTHLDVYKRQAEKILADDVADLVILGDAAAIRASGRALDGARVVDPRTSDLREELAGTLYELRQRKGMTPEQALALMDDCLLYTSSST